MKLNSSKSYDRAALGRHCQLTALDEQHELPPDADLRLPQYRREVFLRFYEFHLQFRAHPGCVYYLMPELAARLRMDLEQKLWFAFINGNSQNPVMSYIIFSKYPEPSYFVEANGAQWFRDHWELWQWDTDRRYQKKDFPLNATWYHETRMNEFLSTGGLSQFPTFLEQWKFIRKFPTFGRLSAFSYMEYLRIMGAPCLQDCDNLFLEDISGSMSHRNGIAKVLGRDDLDFVDKNPVYSAGQIDWLKQECEILLAEARQRFQHRDFMKDVGYFTLESALCTYKSWHRENRRYANVYNDMLHDRIRWAQQQWPRLDFSIFWDIRRSVLPEPLRLEDNPRDVGVKPEKQNHYRLTGRPPMLGYAWPELWSDYDTRVQGMTAQQWHSLHGSVLV